jgi:hypothetical protein
MPPKRSIGIASIALGLILVYAAGTGFRERYGIRVEVKNETPAPLKKVRIEVQDSGAHSRVDDIAVGGNHRAFIQPKTESHIDLTFLGQDGTEHAGTVVGYAEYGYCGRVNVTVRAGYRIDSTDLMQDCSRGWFAFF